VLSTEIFLSETIRSYENQVACFYSEEGRFDRQSCERPGSSQSEVFEWIAIFQKGNQVLVIMSTYKCRRWEWVVKLDGDTFVHIVIKTVCGFLAGLENDSEGWGRG